MNSASAWPAKAFLSAFEIAGFMLRTNARQDSHSWGCTVGPGSTGLIAGQPGDPRTWGVTLRARY